MATFTADEKAAALESLSLRLREDNTYLIGKTFLTEDEFVAQGGQQAVKFSVASAIEALSTSTEATE